MNLKLVKTPKELVEKWGDECLLVTDENGRTFFTEAKVTFMELDEVVE